MHCKSFEGLYFVVFLQQVLAEIDYMYTYTDHEYSEQETWYQMWVAAWEALALVAEGMTQEVARKQVITTDLADLTGENMSMCMSMCVTFACMYDCVYVCMYVRGK
jgi:hypothetical protein